MATQNFAYTTLLGLLTGIPYSQNADQTHFMGVPAGWEIAPSVDPMTSYIASQYMWSGTVVYVDGGPIYTEGINGGLPYPTTNYWINITNGYIKPSMGNVLIRQ